MDAARQSMENPQQNPLPRNHNPLLLRPNQVRILQPAAQRLGLQAAASIRQRLRRVLPRMLLEGLASFGGVDEEGQAQSWKGGASCGGGAQFL